jgi:hypothetical protein
MSDAVSAAFWSSEKLNQWYINTIPYPKYAKNESKRINHHMPIMSTVYHAE